MRTVCLYIAGVASALAYNVPLGRAIHRAPARSAIITLQQAPADAVQIVSDETYGLMLSTLLKTNNSISSEISANYAMVDYGFLQRLYARRARTQSPNHDPAHTHCQTSLTRLFYSPQGRGDRRSGRRGAPAAPHLHQGGGER